MTAHALQFKGHLGTIWTDYTAKDRQRDSEEGQFGWIPQYWCDHCQQGTDSEPETVCTERESWGYWGGSPAEYEWRCPNCGSYDIFEHDNPPTPTYRAVRRFKVM